MSWLDTLDQALTEIAKAFGISGSVVTVGSLVVLFGAFCVIVYRKIK